LGGLSRAGFDQMVIQKGARSRGGKVASKERLLPWKVADHVGEGAHGEK